MNKLRTTTAASLLSLLIASTVSLPSFAAGMSQGGWNGKSYSGSTVTTPSSTPAPTSSTTSSSSSSSSSSTPTPTPMIMFPVTNTGNLPGDSTGLTPASTTSGTTQAGHGSGHGSGHFGTAFMNLFTCTGCNTSGPGANGGELAYYIGSFGHPIVQLFIPNANGVTCNLAGVQVVPNVQTPSYTWEVVVGGDLSKLVPITVFYIGNPNNPAGGSAVYVLGGTTVTPNADGSSTIKFDGTPPKLPFGAKFAEIFLVENGTSGGVVIYPNTFLINGTKHVTVVAGSNTNGATTCGFIEQQGIGITPDGSPISCNCPPLGP